VTRPSLTSKLFWIKSFSSEEKRMFYIPLAWEGTFEDVEAVDREPYLDALYNDAAEVGCSCASQAE
jgi:hypothetical protein